MCLLTVAIDSLHGLLGGVCLLSPIVCDTVDQCERSCRRVVLQVDCCTQLTHATYARRQPAGRSRLLQHTCEADEGRADQHSTLHHNYRQACDDVNYPQLQCRYNCMADWQLATATVCLPLTATVSSQLDSLEYFNITQPSIAQYRSYHVPH